MTYTYIGNRKFEYTGMWKGGHWWEHRTLSNKYTIIYREGFGLLLKDFRSTIAEVPYDFDGDVASLFDDAINDSADVRSYA